MLLMEDNILRRNLQNTFVNGQIHAAAQAEYESKIKFETIIKNRSRTRKYRCSLQISCASCRMAGDCQRATNY